ncbi:hypothetical protein [Streptomyces sp. S.PB5]|uniref:hypothetical protein n=1 Tax=Streptomyces sp. S.PB5 TaxID=3020844 RepID=UPI0025B2499B|nr:hypothetical protein [Streptomyces sp. S.PB5]MDN3028239.1 hypothetical protein [Streptomyces sp. S.PB5]
MALISVREDGCCTGAGTIVGGRLHRGPNGAAAEIGSLRLPGWCDVLGDLEAHGADAEAVFSAALGGIRFRIDATAPTAPAVPWGRIRRGGV